jgi:uncharacterized protein YceK
MKIKVTANRRTFRRTLEFAFPLATAFCSGCGTIGSHANSCGIGSTHQAYAGVRADAALVGEGSAGYILDFPFSAVADTILLPVDLWPEKKSETAGN